MEKVFISKKVLNSIYFLIFICMVCVSCHSNSESSKEGSMLPEYLVVNKSLDSITSWILKENEAKLRAKKVTVVLELNVLENDTIGFVYSFHEDEDDIRTKLIALRNKRVVGYLHRNSKDVLILTNIDYYHDLKILKEFISAGTGSKRFKYLYFTPIRLDVESMYEPLLWDYKYKNGTVSKLSIHK